MVVIFGSQETKKKEEDNAEKNEICQYFNYTFIIISAFYFLSYIDSYILDGINLFHFLYLLSTYWTIRNSF